ncbi:helix-turn-helix domain-containing protein [Leuconostoc citreum]|uniref:helix-turn-helix domain-containing protein n=1 Tax=Leuconostoc citreum TaxID=33964 RepID=UPI0032DE411D
MNRLKELREKNKLTLRKLYERTGISDVNLSRYERNLVNPKKRVWKKLSDYYHVPVSYLKGTDRELDDYLNNMVDKNFRLKKLRKNKNLTLEDIQKQTGIKRSTFSDYENDHTEPNIKTLIALAGFFNVSIDYLVGRTDE